MGLEVFGCFMVSPKSRTKTNIGCSKRILITSCNHFRLYWCGPLNSWWIQRAKCNVLHIISNFKKILTSDSLCISMTGFKGCHNGGFTWASMWYSIVSISVGVISSTLYMFHTWCDKFLDLVWCCSSLVTFYQVYK